MKRSSWSDYQKEIADDKYYYVRSCIRQNFFPGSEKAFLNMLQKDLGRDVFDDPLHTSCTGIGYHSDIVPLDTIMTVVARQFALMTDAGYENFISSCITSFGIYTEILATWEEFPEKEEQTREYLYKATGREFRKPKSLAHTSDIVFHLREEIARTDSVAGNLSATLERDRAQYGEMVREAYRNYKHNNYLTYIFSSRDFTDVARKITALREVASLRERKLRDIEALTAEVRTEKETLDRRKRSLDSVTRSLSAQREKLQRDARNAKASIRSMSQKEKTALQRKIAQEQQLDVAIGELRKLTKGNTEGASFSAKTSGLRLPVTAGRVKRYKENMAEITGPKGAHVISIYDGKVVDVKRNRITNKYDVYVAHGEYITSYANMGTICVEKGQKVARNAQIGTIGSAVNVMTMETEYKLVFGIYPPNPGQKMRAEECFRK